MPAFPHRLSCGQTWSSSGATAGVLTLPGLEVWVQSVPAGAAGAGGDVHYFSNCPQCVVSRIALADVSGHGEEVIAFADALRRLMIKHLTALDQEELMRDLNRVSRLALGSFHYATMLAMGWHHRRGLLVITNAGHPPPMFTSPLTSTLDVAGHRSELGEARRRSSRLAGRHSVFPSSDQIRAG